MENNKQVLLVSYGIMKISFILTTVFDIVTFIVSHTCQHSGVSRFLDPSLATLCFVIYSQNGCTGTPPERDHGQIEGVTQRSPGFCYPNVDRYVLNTRCYLYFVA